MGFTKTFSLLVMAFLFFSPGALATGDCNFDGTVTIAEAESAINMFLGLKQPAATCVDEDLSGDVSISEAQKTVASFLGILPAGITYGITGRVLLGGSGLSDVLMTLSGAGSATALTDAAGNYGFNGLVNGAYLITPGKTGFKFDPTSLPQSVNGGNISAVNFTATPVQSAQIVACPPSGTTDVTIRNFSFAPAAVTVGVGTIVKWTNDDPFTHTVTSGSPPDFNGQFDAGDLSAGSRVCVQFSVTGSYSYFCAIHNSMTGSVTVR